MTVAFALFGGAIVTAFVLLVTALIILIARLLGSYPFVLFTLGVMLIWLVCSAYIWTGGLAIWNPFL